VTVTLPERTLRQLAGYDADRAKAIARLAEMVLGGGKNAPSKVRLVEIERGTSVIVVGSSRSLARLRFLRRVEVSPGCYLLVIPSGTPIESLELELVDLLDDIPHDEEGERRLVDQLRTLIRRSRRGNRVSKAEILLISSDDLTRGR
jgi:hypothetical protein